MVGEQLCLFGCDGGCGVCGRAPPAWHTGNVIGIFDRRPVSPTSIDAESQPYRDEVAEVLADLAARARDGAFTGLAIVLNGDDDMTTIATLGALDDPIIFLGGLARIAHRINTENDLDED